jgi:hypothetical protein
MTRFDWLLAKREAIRAALDAQSAAYDSELSVQKWHLWSEMGRLNRLLLDLDREEHYRESAREEGIELPTARLPESEERLYQEEIVARTVPAA